jgi:hypothetical protein
MTPKDKELHLWLVREAAFTAGYIMRYWAEKRIGEAVR